MGMMEIASPHPQEIYAFWKKSFFVFFHKSNAESLWKQRPSALLSGTPEGNRTPSLTLRRGALYPIELLARMAMKW